MKKHFLALTFLLGLIFCACTNKNIPLYPKTEQSPSSLPKLEASPKNYEQIALKDIKPLAYEPLASTYEWQANINLGQKLLTKRFEVFELKSVTEPASSLFWAFDVYKFSPKNRYFFANLKPVDAEFFTKAKEMANFSALGSVSAPAITTTNSSMRNFPTSQALFKDPNKAGEGYPFDYLQTSALNISQPLFVSHYSLDGAWALVRDDNVWGWVKSGDIKILSSEEAQKLKKGKFIAIKSENTPVYSQNGEFLFYARVGSILQINGENEESFFGEIYTQAGLKDFKISKNVAAHFPMALNQQNIKSLVSTLLGQEYGWGGINGLRDCSLFTRDFLMGFGIWLPRNSKAQARAGKEISLAGLSKKQKIELIKSKAIPYLSLLYLKGHIMLYVGINQDGEPLVLHDAWGLKTIGSGRAIIGGINITTLNLGSQRLDIASNDLLINRLESLSILVENTNAP